MTDILGNGGGDTLQIGPNLDACGYPQDELIDPDDLVATAGEDIPGNSHTLSLYGGDGNDTFVRNRNSAELNLFGGNNDDLIVMNTAIHPDTNVYLVNAAVILTAAPASTRLS